MILGRWSSAAFVNYIRPQVMEWTAGMSTSMLQSPDFRHTDPCLSTPASASPTSPKAWSAADLDSLQANLDAAVKTPKEITFNGSTCEATSLHQMNLKF
ncbi:hypothetical protein ACA910_021171 [Epithemia clementina (nom. ined.)]